MLMRFDPFGELDRLARQFTADPARPASVPMDAVRKGDELVVHLDLPGVDPSSIELTVEQSTLTVRAERAQRSPDDAELLVRERPYGVFTRQLFLGDGLDTERIDASYDNGVLTVRLPVAEQAKPRKIEIASSSRRKQLESTAA